MHQLSPFERKGMQNHGEKRLTRMSALLERENFLSWFKKQTLWAKVAMLSIIPLLGLLVFAGVEAVAGPAILPLATPSPTIARQGQQGETKVSRNVVRQGPSQLTIPSLRAPRAAVPTSRPTAAPSPTPTLLPASDLFVRFVSVYGIDYSSAKASIHTLPGAVLSIDVVYCSGGSHDPSNSLQGTATADSNGDYTWYWVPKTPCKGPARAYVTANYNNRTITTPGDFTVK